MNLYEILQSYGSSGIYPMHMPGHKRNPVFQMENPYCLDVTEIEGMDDLGGGKIVRAYVPLSEMFGYSTDLRSKTQGRGNYSMFFEKYEPVPKSVQEKIIAEHKH